MDKVWLSKAAVIVAALTAILCVVFILSSYSHGQEVPERVWGMLGGAFMLLFGIQLPTPTNKV